MAEKIKILIAAKDQTKAAFKSVDTKMTKLKKSSKLMAAALGPIGGFAASGALVTIGVQALKSADDIQKMSARLGVSTEALSQYRHVAALSGTSFETLAKSVKISQRAIADAGHGLSTATMAFDKMGLSAADLNRLKPEDAFEAMGAAIAGMSNTAERTRTAMAIFGGAGLDLIPMFKDGAGAVREMREEADRLGLTLDQVSADKAAAAVDAMQRMKAAADGLQLSFAGVIAEPIADLFNNIARTFTHQTPFQQMTAGMERLKKEAPEAYAEIRQMQKDTRGVTVEMTLAAIKAAELAASFRVLGAGFVAPDMASNAAAQWPITLREQGGAMSAALKDTTSAFTNMDAAIANLDEGLTILDWYGQATAVDALTASTERLGPAFDQADDSSRRLSDGLTNEGINSAQNFGDSIVDAALRGEGELLKLDNMLKNVIGSFLKFGISFGLNSYLPGASALPIPGLNTPGGAIGPVQSLAPGTIGTSSAAAATAGPQTIINGGITIKADMPLTNDPMTKRRVAEQLYDEIREVGKHRGNEGRL